MCVHLYLFYFMERGQCQIKLLKKKHGRKLWCVREKKAAIEEEHKSKVKKSA